MDGSHRLDGTTLGSYVMLHIITLYVGGGPSPLYKNRPTHNFKGCLKKVELICHKRQLKSVDFLVHIFL